MEDHRREGHDEKNIHSYSIMEQEWIKLLLNCVISWWRHVNADVALIVAVVADALVDVVVDVVAALIVAVVVAALVDVVVDVVASDRKTGFRCWLNRGPCEVLLVVQVLYWNTVVLLLRRESL